MAEKSFLKGYCPKHNRYFGMTLEKYNGRWEVVDFIPLSKEEAKVLPSLVEQSSFETHKNLLPCKYSGRTIRSCSRIECPRDSKQYSFQCVYCNKMELDYGSDLSGTQYKEGDTITLSQGQEVKIALGGKDLEAIELNVGWDPTYGSKNMDIDSSIFLFKDSVINETVYFGRKEDSAGSVLHHGDNLTGEPVNGQSDVDEVIDVNLKKVPQKYNNIAVIINIYNCMDRNQNFGTVKNLFIRLYDKKTRKKICDYQIGHNISNKTGLVIGLLSRSGSGWKFKASGDAYYVKDIAELCQEILRNRQ